jgi:HSP20 family protein
MKRPHLPVAFVISRHHHLPEENSSHLHGPPVDVVDEGTGWRLVFEIPGAQIAHVSLQVEGRLVTLRGECPPTERGAGQFLCIERVAGPFERTVELPEPPDPEKTQASYADGLLTVEIPKLHRTPGRSIPVRRGDSRTKP